MEKENVSQKIVKELADGAPTKGLVEVRLIDPKKTGSVTIRDYKNNSGKIRPYVDQHGQHRVLKVTRTLNLDMTNMDDRLTLKQIENHPIYVKGSMKSLKIVNHEVEADKVVGDKDLEAKAMGIIQKLNGEELHSFARVLLITVKPGSSDKVVKRVIYEMAAENPKGILEEWEHPLREIKATVKLGVEKGVFTYKMGRYTFKNQLMGTSFELAVDWLKENEDLMPQIRKEIG